VAGSLGEEEEGGRRREEESLAGLKTAFMASKHGRGMGAGGGRGGDLLWHSLGACCKAIDNYLPPTSGEEQYRRRWPQGSMYRRGREAIELMA